MVLSILMRLICRFILEHLLDEHQGRVFNVLQYFVSNAGRLLVCFLGTNPHVLDVVVNVLGEDLGEASDRYTPPSENPDTSVGDSSYAHVATTRWVSRRP